ncbi:MAG: hypothetical protein IJR99_16740 [Kiritimatiellae bacterium]|nr:hypothetical protein [Kiritimatiellia bacterium]
MNEDAGKSGGWTAQGKEKTQALYNKGNELMDKVPFLKNPLYKKIAWGVAGVICVLLVSLFFYGITSLVNGGNSTNSSGSGGANSSSGNKSANQWAGGNTPFGVAKKALVACASGDGITYLSLCDDSSASEEQRLAASILMKKLKEQMDEAESTMSDEEFKLFSLHMKKEWREEHNLARILIQDRLDSNTDSWAFESWSDDVWSMVEQALNEMKEIETKVDGNKATVVASVSLKGKDLRIKVHLLKFEGEWKVDASATEKETWMN